VPGTPTASSSSPSSNGSAGTTTTVWTAGSGTGRLAEVDAALTATATSGARTQGLLARTASTEEVDERLGTVQRDDARPPRGAVAF
jgi:hypothetical protein